MSQIQDINPQQSVYAFIKEAYNYHKAKTAIIYYGRSISFTKYFKLIERFATGLASIGVKRGDKVTVCLPNIPQNCISFYALSMIGAISNIVHPLMPNSEIERSMRSMGSKVLITSDSVLVKGKIDEGIVVWCGVSDFMDVFHKIGYSVMRRKERFSPLRRYISFFQLLKIGKNKNNVKPVDLSGNECACIMHSGGTTGESKLVLHSHVALNRMICKKEYFLKGVKLAGLASYTVLPTFHGFGLCMNTHISSAYALKQIMAVKFNPKEAVKWIKKYKVNYINGVPSIFYALLKQKGFNRKTAISIDRCYVGGDNVTENLIYRFNEKVSGDKKCMKLFEGYGLTEMIAVCMLNTPECYKVGTGGKAIPGCACEVIIDDIIQPRGVEGEIYVSGDIMMMCYYNDIEGTQRVVKMINGVKWLKTGDWGYVDEDGFLHFKQRVKHVIIRKGANVFPCEIEDIINRLDYVKQCCVVGKYINKEDSQTIYAYVNLMDKNMRNEKTVEAIKKYVSENAVKFAVPEKVIFTKKFPRTIIGKIDIKYFENRPD